MVSVLELDTRFGVSLDHIAGATIWPAMIGWLGISGVGILWKLRLITGRGRLSPAPIIVEIYYYVWYLVGVVFIGGAILLIWALVRPTIDA